MLPCACSLRSTQCAALIALAAVAGLARIERVDVPTDRVQASAQSVIGNTGEASRFFQAFAKFVFGAFAPAKSLSPAADQYVDSADPLTAEPWRVPSHLASLVATESQALLFLQFLPPNSRSHKLPWAVGPPAGGVTLINLRVDGTAVPCDSTTRQVIVSRIARISPEAKMASGPCEPGIDRRPSPALRGTPGFPAEKAPSPLRVGKAPSFFA
jgi:hypothetical protein